MTSRNRVALIADDDEFFRMALATILTGKLGFSDVVQTASLDEAVEKLSARGDVSLALFDLAMPGMESPASLRAVRDCFTKLKIAVVSGSMRRRDILSALEAGVHGYVPKGLGVAELAHAAEVGADDPDAAPARCPRTPRAGKIQQGDRPRTGTRRGHGEGPHGCPVP